MFEPSREEVADAEALLQSLLTQGRKEYYSPKSQAERIRAQQEELALRSAAASAAALARLAWRPQASIALLNVCTCVECGSRQTHFEGYGVLMTRQTDSATRIVMTPVLDEAFPRRTHYTETHLPACAACLPRHGFTL